MKRDCWVACGSRKSEKEKCMKEKKDEMLLCVVLL